MEPPSPAANQPLAANVPHVSDLAPAMVDVVARLAAEVAAPLTQALERLADIAHSGRLDRQGLLALRRQVEAARQAGLIGQRIARLASGQAQPGIERVDLGRVLQATLNDLSAAAVSGTHGHRLNEARAQVMGDASLLHTVLLAAAHWAQEQAQGLVDWTLETTAWPPTAHLHCRFDTAGPATAAAGVGPVAGQDSLNWLLLGHAAHLSGVQISRSSLGQRQTLSLQFRHLAQDGQGGGNGDSAALDSAHSARALLSGCQILVLATQRDLRQRVRAALRGQEVFVDHVPNITAAEHYCDDGSPQVLLYESGFEGDALRRLRGRLAGLTPPVILIELVPHSQECHAAGQAVRLGTEALEASLAPVLVMALSRQR